MSSERQDKARIVPQDSQCNGYRTPPRMSMRDVLVTAEAVVYMGRLEQNETSK